MSSLIALLRLRQAWWILLLPILLVLSTFPSDQLYADTGAESLLDRLIALERAHQDLWPDSAGVKDLRSESATINEMFLADKPGDADGAATIRSLNQLVFDELHLQATHELENPEHLFLSGVLMNRRGYCLGLAALYLVLAELNDIPLYAVSTPTHVFLRYDDGVTRVNIETFQRGAHLTDEQYAREHSIPEQSIRNGVFLRNLNDDEFLAQIYNNIGVIYSKREEYDLAEEAYGRALELYPDFPAAYYNLGNDLIQRGQFKQAVKSFKRALRLYPTDIWALNNRGLAYRQMDKLEKARRDFEDALRIDPRFGQARKNLSDIQELL